MKKFRSPNSGSSLFQRNFVLRCQSSFNRFEKIHRILRSREIAKRTLNETGIPAEHRQGMGGTITFGKRYAAGKSTSIRSIRERSRKNSQDRTAIVGPGNSGCVDEIRRRDDEPLGFNNTMRLSCGVDAQRLGIRHDRRIYAIRN